MAHQSVKKLEWSKILKSLLRLIYLSAFTLVEIELVLT
jgi:hypothetical protein